LAWVGRRAEIGFSPLLFGPNLLVNGVLFHGIFFYRRNFLVRDDVGVLLFKIGKKETKEKRRFSRKSSMRKSGNQAFSWQLLSPIGEFRSISTEWNGNYGDIQEL